MKDFQFTYPVNVTFGKDAETKVGEAAIKFGKKVLIHHDSGAYLEESGLLPRIRESLKAAGCEILELGGVRPNPRLSLMKEGMEICRKEGIDVVIGVGGGSVMDSAKAIAVGAKFEGDIWDICLWKAQANTRLPLILIPTMSGTGSEVSICAMIVNDELTPEVKRGMISFNVLPDVTLINPELQYSLPRNQVASGCMDIISHTLTTWFTDTPDVFITDRMAEGVIETVVKYAPVALENPTDYNARAQIAMAASLAVVFMVGFDRDGRDACHTLENGFTTMHMIAHGTGLAIIVPAWMKHVYKRDVQRFALFANRIMGVTVDPFDLEGTAREGVIRFEQYIKDRLGLPTRMSDLGLAEKTDIDALVELVCNNNGGCVNAGSPYELTRDDIRAIYELAK